jgi:hypothetical protein
MESLRSDTDSENRRTRRNVCLSDTSSTKNPTSAVTGRVIHGTAVHYRQNGLHTSHSTSMRRDIAYLLLYFYIRVEVRVWLRRLAADLSPRRPGFATCSLDVGFVVEKVTLGQVFSLSYLVSRCQYIIPPLLHTHLSPPHEVCDSSGQAAHYHTVGTKGLHL